MKLSRRRFLWAAGGTGLTAAAYGFCWESKWLQLTFSTVPIARSPGCGPVRILLVSDLHWSPFDSLEFLRSALSLGLDQGPDLVCLAGDLVSVGNQYDLDRYRPVLESLSRVVPTYAVLGNHDGGKWSRSRNGLADESSIQGLLRDSGIEVLDNASVKVSPRGHELCLIGLSDLWAGSQNPETAFAGVERERDTVKIVMAHNPDSKDYIGDFDWQLMMSGHTHGGQIVIPLIGAPFVPVRDKRFVKGLNCWRDRFIYTTRGVGSLYGTRFYCRPEVTILDIACTNSRTSAGCANQPPQMPNLHGT